MILKDNYYTGIWYYLQAVQSLEPMEIEKCLFLGRPGGTNAIPSISFSHPSTNQPDPAYLLRSDETGHVQGGILYNERLTCKSTNGRMTIHYDAH